MGNEITKFTNEEFGEIRTIQNNGEILFCGSDVAKALGYSNTRDALSRHCKGVVKCDAPTNGGIQSLGFISEGNVYRLIAHSKLPSAERFERWMFDEVLPTVHNMCYNTNNSQSSCLSVGSNGDITRFSNEEFGEIRIVLINDEPWFVGRDIASSLGYGNISDALKSHVAQEDKRVFQQSENATFEIPTRGLTIINESGLYSLILSSKLPSATRFKRWVTSEVLPSIRKHGAYMTAETIERTLTDPDFIISLATELKAERQARIEAEQKLEEQKPLVDFVQHIACSEESVSMGELAKIRRLIFQNCLLNIRQNWLDK